MMEDATAKVRNAVRRGRGTLSNASGRFEARQRVGFDDGWDSEEPLPPLRTVVTRDSSRTVIATNTSPDINFDQSINPYRGCEHGCSYCYARPSHAFLGLSPGLDFETRLLMKDDAPRLLEKELRRPGYRCKVIAIGSNTDPYQPLEKRMRITREILKVLSAFNHPVGIVTKSQLVARDLDILADMAGRGLVKVCISVTTLEPKLARAMEPRASTPIRRLRALAALSEAGVPTGVMVAPVIPALNDPEIEAILQAAADAGVREAAYVLLRLPLEIKELWREWLAEHYPDRASRIMRLLREMRGGRDYDAAFGQRMKGSGPYAALIARRFRLACDRHGLNERTFELETGQFRPPPAPGDQLRLF